VCVTAEVTPRPYRHSISCLLLRQGQWFQETAKGVLRFPQVVNILGRTPVPNLLGGRASAP